MDYLIITSSENENLKMHDDEEFILVATLKRDNKKNDTIFIFYKDGMDMDQMKEENSTESEHNTENDEYIYQNCAYLSDVSDKIANIVKNLYKQETFEDLMIMINIFSYHGVELKNKLNKMFVSKSIELKAISFKDTFKILSMDQFEKSLKFKFNNSEFIYLDPISLGFHTYRFLQK